jgi:hypothetical protein
VADIAFDIRPMPSSPSMNGARHMPARSIRGMLIGPLSGWSQIATADASSFDHTWP